MAGPIGAVPLASLIAAPHDPCNPDNGHLFECSCPACSLYWTSEAGSRVFWDWMRRRPHL